MTPTIEIFEEPAPKTAWAWWAAQRKKYNIGLIVAGIAAFICYVIIATYFIAPYDPDFEISGIATFMQGIGYLIMIGVANVFYYLGYFIDRLFNTGNHLQFRVTLFNLGFWFSCALPFLIPMLVFATYLINYRQVA